MGAGNEPSSNKNKINKQKFERVARIHYSILVADRRTSTSNGPLLMLTFSLQNFPEVENPFDGNVKKKCFATNIIGSKNME